MKPKNVIAVVSAIAILFVMNVTQMFVWKNKDDKYKVCVNNLKAQNQKIGDECVAYIAKAQHLQYMLDSQISSLDSMRTQLGIKDNKIKQLSKTKQTHIKHDTIRVHDTIIQNDVCFDTCVDDEWRSLCVGVSYPNEITVKNTVNLETDCFLYVERQTVNPPCKTWIGRLFQKKHNVYKMKIVEHNPYVTTNESKLIIIEN